MKRVAVLLAPGFEEAEAIVTIDILRRLHIDVETLTCTSSRAVVSYHAIPMVADAILSERRVVKECSAGRTGGERQPRGERRGYRFCYPS